MFDTHPDGTHMTKNDRYGLLQTPWTAHPTTHLHSTTMSPFEPASPPARPPGPTGPAPQPAAGSPPEANVPAATLGPTSDPGQEAFPDIEHPFDEREFRTAMGAFASGVTVITTHGPDGPVGFTCQSFFSVSVDPPLISFSVARTSRSLAALRDHGRVVVNFLSRDQQQLSGQFARSGTDKWRGVSWHPSPSNGAPTLDEVTGWVAGEIDREIEAGDHLIFLVRVTGLSAPVERAPLLFYRGAYHELEYMI